MSKEAKQHALGSFNGMFHIPESLGDKQKLIDEILQRSGSVDMMYMIALIESLYQK